VEWRKEAPGLVDGRLSTTIPDAEEQQAEHSKALRYQASKKVNGIIVLSSNQCRLSSYNRHQLPRAGGIEVVKRWERYSERGFAQDVVSWACYIISVSTHLVPQYGMISRHL
jgi:hypothetical protein